MKRTNTVASPGGKKVNQATSNDTTPKGRYKSVIFPSRHGASPSNSKLPAGYLRTFGFASTHSSSLPGRLLTFYCSSALRVYMTEFFSWFAKTESTQCPEKDNKEVLWYWFFFLTFWILKNLYPYPYQDNVQNLLSKISETPFCGHLRNMVTHIWWTVLFVQQKATHLFCKIYPLNVKYRHLLTGTMQILFFVLNHKLSYIVNPTLRTLGFVYSGKCTLHIQLVYRHPTQIIRSK